MTEQNSANLKKSASVEDGLCCERNEFLFDASGPIKFIGQEHDKLGEEIYATYGKLIHQLSSSNKVSIDLVVNVQTLDKRLLNMLTYLEEMNKFITSIQPQLTYYRSFVEDMEAKMLSKKLETLALSDEALEKFSARIEQKAKVVLEELSHLMANIKKVGHTWKLWNNPVYVKEGKFSFVKPQKKIDSEQVLIWAFDANKFSEEGKEVSNMVNYLLKLSAVDDTVKGKLSNYEILKGQGDQLNILLKKMHDKVIPKLKELGTYVRINVEQTMNALQSIQNETSSNI